MRARLEIVRTSKPDLEHQVEALLVLLRAAPARTAPSMTELSQAATVIAPPAKSRGSKRTGRRGAMKCIEDVLTDPVEERLSASPACRRVT
jgi:hypothetical protein